MSRLPRSFGVVSRILEGDVFVVTINVCHTYGTESVPGVASVLKDGNRNGHDRSSTNARDTAIQTWVSLPD